MAYSRLDFWRFALALAITSIPLLLLQRESARWAWGYAILILVGFAVTHSAGLTKAANYVSGKLRAEGQSA